MICNASRTITRTRDQLGNMSWLKYYKTLQTENNFQNKKCMEIDLKIFYDFHSFGYMFVIFNLW